MCEWDLIPMDTDPAFCEKAMGSAPRRCEMKVCGKICFLKIRLEVCVLENQTKRSKAEPHEFGRVERCCGRPDQP